MTKSVTLKEYDYLLRKSSQYKITEDNNVLEPEVFDELTDLIDDSASDDENDIRSIFLRRDGKLQARDYVGVIQTSDGTLIEILPKIADSYDDETLKKILLNMLREVGDLPYKRGQTASLKTNNFPLLEMFIRDFLECVDVIVKRGIRSDYIRQEDNLPFMKGKLLMNQQIKYNAIRKERFYVEFDSFERNRPENRLIKSSLQKVLKISRDYRNQRLARELLFMFDDVPFSTDYKQDFQKCSKDRGMYYYRDSLDWCQLILEDKSPVSNKGEKIFRSFLFYMPKLFEKYVEVKLRQKLRTGYMLNPQAKEKTRYICTHINNEGMFKLKPDYLLIEKENSKPLYVLDAKWKLISNDKSDKNYGNYGIKQDDFYQMFAYGHKYLKGQGQMALIYPKTDEFNKRLEPFYFDESDEKKLTLWVVPFDLAKDKNELDLPLELSIFTSSEIIEKS